MSKRPAANPETIQYVHDPHRGDKRAHAIARKARNGWTPRKIAKHFGVPLAEVNDVLRKEGT